MTLLLASLGLIIFGFLALLCLVARLICKGDAK